MVVHANLLTHYGGFSLKMITVTDLSLRFSDKKLFEDVNVKFTPGNCYGVIGANGAGKTTFIRILSGEMDPSSGQVTITPGERLATLKQNQFAYDEFPVLETVMMGYPRLYEIIREKEALYSLEDFTEADGLKAADLEHEFAEMNGWDAETDAEKLLNGLGVNKAMYQMLMKDLPSSDKVKVLLAQALFGNPNILLLDEPTNHLDLHTQEVLESVLSNFAGTILLVSHDRYLIDSLATQIWEVDPQGRSLHVFKGSYTEYKAQQVKQAEQEASAEVPIVVNEPTKRQTKTETGKTLSKYEQKKIRAKLAEIEQEVAELEKQQAFVSSALENPPDDPVKVQRLGEKYVDLQKKSEVLLAEWTKLEERLAG